LAFAGFEHWPVAELQVPALWHWSDAVQTFGVPVHVPLWQVYVLHLSLPVQGTPLADDPVPHTPRTHVATRHGFLGAEQHW
jgi:hypothetical protein